MFYQAPDVQPSASTSKRKIASVTQPLDEETLIQMATETFVKELGLEDDPVLLDGKVEIREVPAGTYLMKEESHKVCMGVGGILHIAYSLKVMKLICLINLYECEQGSVQHLGQTTNKL